VKIYIARLAALVAILGSGLPTAPCVAGGNGIILFGSNDPSVIFQSSLASAASIESISGGSVTGTPTFDPVNGMVPGAAGGAYFEGSFLNTPNAGQLTLEVETTLISQPSPDQVADAIGGSQGYNHLADGWQTLLDIRSADDTAIASLGLTSTAGIGGNYRGINFVGLGVHSAGKSAFVRVTLSWTGNTYGLYVDGLLVSSGSAAALDIGKIAVGYFAPGSAGILRYHIRNLILSSQAVNLPTHPLLGMVVIYGDSFASQANPYAIGSTEFESTAGFQLLRDMNNAGMSIGQLLLKDYPGETLNKTTEPNQVSFQLGTNRFNGAADKLTDVVNANADYVIIMGGTNDAAGDAAERGAVAPSFAGDLLSMCRTILNNPRTKGIVMQTIMSLKGKSVLATPTFVAYVSTVNTMIRALPSAWDSTYPGEQGKIKVVDNFTATGGESAASDMEKGTLTGVLDDMHPTAFASVISGNLMAGALQSFLATTGEIPVTSCVTDQNGVILQSSATLTIDLGGATPCTGYGQYSVAQSLTLNQPVLNVILTNGFTPAAGQSFAILSWVRLSGTFGTVTLPTLPGGLSWDTSALYTAGTITVEKPAAPTIGITAGASQAFTAGKSAVPVTFTIAGGGALKVTAVSSNTALLPNSGILVSSNCGSTLPCSASYSLSSGQTGSSTVTLTVADAYGQAGSATATVAVSKPAAPTISITQGGSQSFTAGSSPVPVAFTVAGTGALNVTAASSDTILLPSVSLTPNCGSAVLSCSAKFAVAAGQSGTSTVTLRVADAYGQSGTANADVQVNPPPTEIRLGGGGGVGIITLLGLACLSAMRWLTWGTKDNIRWRARPALPG